MIHERPTEEMVERAALYALGALPPEEAAAFEAHLREGCRACQGEMETFAAVTGQLGYAVVPEGPPLEVRGRLLARLSSGAAGPVAVEEVSEVPAPAGGPRRTVVRSAEVEWQAAGPGVAVKPLFQDPAEERLTILARMEPGAQYPSHEHAGTEEVYLLGGDLKVEDQVLRAGDYCGAPPGSVHTGASTDAGCTLLIMASERDRILGEEGPEAPKQGLVFVRSTEGAWRELGSAGVAVKPIFTDLARGTTTALVRMRAGASLARSHRTRAQQLYVIEGDARVTSQVLRAGDYYRAGAGTPGEDIGTEGGCLFLLNSARQEIPGGVPA